MKRTHSFPLFVLGAAIALSCVQNRPTRNGLRDENVYLNKQDFTQANPKTPAVSDDGWLYKVTVVKTSSPNVAGDLAFPGVQSETSYVKFRFTDSALQLVDGRSLQWDDPNNPNDDLGTQAGRVIQEFQGSNVDVKLRETLDGERTNFVEENTELPWQERQTFKIDFAKTSLDPVTSMAWYYGELLHDCARPMSQHVLPGSFEWDADDQYLSFVIEASYLVTLDGACYDMISLLDGAGTTTIQYRLSFYRPGASTYQPQLIAEKDPVNKKYGSFQVQNLFRDPKSGLLSSQNLIQRWNPDREDPVIFYFHPGFPVKFKAMFKDEIEPQTNALMDKAGAKLRFRFEDADETHQFGDIRYSFVVWHSAIDSTKGLLGYGPSSSDPRTGELLSANVNLYDIGMDYYRFLIQNFLETVAAQTKPDPMKSWEEIDCSASASPLSKASARYTSGMFQEMARVLEIQEPTGKPDDFLPKKQLSNADFLTEFQRLAPELRYVEPAYNGYTWNPSSFPLAQFKERAAKERQFNESMQGIMRNQNPFGTSGLYTKEGIEAQFGFRDQFQKWRKNHDQFVSDQEMLRGYRCVYDFDVNDALSAIGASARQCVDGKWESDDVYRERIINAVVFHVAIHEFGHNLSLRHNFYGSVDAKNMKPGELSASVMDYVASSEEAGSPRAWGGYDEAALQWIYGTDAVRAEMMKNDYLYCTDEHRSRSPLCQAHDLGVTPSQIVLNAIERYDWTYELRNKRAYRTFWDTSAYSSQVYSATFPLMRMWYLGLFDWGGGGVQDVLKRSDQLAGKIRTQPEYDAIAMDFTNDVAAATDLMVSFYAAVLNQPSALRNYQTEFDPYYGDILRMGIILDKLYVTFAFMDLQEVYNYDPNISTYVSMYDSPFGTKNYRLTQRVLDDMLGANYDTFPWFRYLALNIFASATNTNLVGDVSLKERIAIHRFNDALELEAQYPGALAQATASGNTTQTFVYNGEQYIYVNLKERGWHLITQKARSPVSYEFMREYNESLNSSASTTEDTYGLKVLLAYYEYFNNFSGY